jgi:hypothetical protein
MAVAAQAQQGSAELTFALSPALAALRNAPLEELARTAPTKDSTFIRTLLTSSDTNDRALAANRIATDSGAVQLTLGLLLRERNAKTMTYAMTNLYYLPWSRKDARIAEALRYVIATHPEPAAVAEALQQYRSITMRWLEDVLTARVAGARAAGHDSLATALAPIQDRAVNLERGLMLPTFLRRSPPVFAKKVSGNAVRVLAFGDFGTASEEQKKAAAAMRSFHAAHRFDFGITLGDNFYTYGLATPSDPRWKTEFEDLYAPMGIEFFPSFGNHDQYDGDAPAAEIARSALSKVWHFPAQFYTYTAGPAQFFAIDTNDPSDVQIQWLKDALDASTAKWKIVYGHFPVFVSVGGRGFWTDSMMLSRVMPALKGRADVFLAGHHHSMQHLAPVDGVNFFIAGGGGAGSYQVGGESDPHIYFAKQENGFAVLDISSTAFGVRFIDKDGKQIYQTTIRKETTKPSPHASK